MKTIGVIGGLTWLSSVEYYKMINQMVNEKLGGVEAAKLILYSVNFAEIKTLTEANDWAGISVMICDAAKKLETAGAEIILIGANTMHKIADDVIAAVDVPVIHIAEVVADEISKLGFRKVALLGTKYTMQLDFYKTKLKHKGIETILPGQADMEYINNAIYNEMGKGSFLPETKARFIEIINKLSNAGAEGIILGCTEIPILIKSKDVHAKLFDTGYIHAKAAVDAALS
jgi:aspartate racemase